MNDNNQINNGLDQNYVPTPNQDNNLNNIQQDTNVNSVPVNTSVETNSIPVTNVEPNNNIPDQNQYNNTQFGNNSYKLILNRKKQFTACGSAFSIYVDNEMVGKIKNGKTLEVDITPGNHTMSVNKKNEISIQVTGDTTADVIVFGSNDFGIININGQSSPMIDEIMNKKVEKAKMNSNVDLIMSLLAQPLISILCIFVLKISTWIVIMTGAFDIGFILIDIAGLKNIKQFFKEKYSSCLTKKIIALIVAIIWVIIFMFISVNNIDSFDKLKNSFSKNRVVEKGTTTDDLDDEEDEDSDWSLEDDDISVQLGELKASVPSNFKEYQKDSNYIIYMTERQDCTAAFLTTPASSYENENAMIKTMISNIEKETNAKADNYNIIETVLTKNTWNKLDTTLKNNETSVKETIYAIKKGDNYYAVQLQSLNDNSLCNLKILTIAYSISF